MTKVTAPSCSHCLRGTRLITKYEIYPNRPDLWGESLWLCDGCGARVGCHPGTTRPLGTPANAELRGLRQQTHAIFDPLWKNSTRPNARRDAYKWLAEQIFMKDGDCHIGSFSIEDCHIALEILRDPKTRFPR